MGSANRNIDWQRVFIFKSPGTTTFQQIALVYSFLVCGCLNVFNYNLIWRAAFYGLLLFFAFGSICITWKNAPMHTRILSITLILIGALIYPLTGTFLVLLLASCGACLIGIPLSKIIETGYRTQLIFFIVIVALYTLGLNKGNDLIPTNSFDRSYRYALGFSHPNTAASYFLFTMILYFSSLKNHRTHKFCIFEIISLLVFSLTDSKTFLLFEILFFLTIIFYHYIVLPKRLVSLFALAFPLLILASYFLCVSFHSSRLNEMLSGRLWYGMEAINTGVSLFGNEIGYPLDIMYLSLIYSDGLVITLFYFCVFTIPFLYLSKRFNNQYRTLLALYGIVILLYSLSETYALNFLTPPSLLFFYFVYNRQNHFMFSKDCCFYNVDASQLTMFVKICTR